MRLNRANQIVAAVVAAAAVVDTAAAVVAAAEAAAVSAGNQLKIAGEQRCSPDRITIRAARRLTNFVSRVVIVVRRARDTGAGNPITVLEKIH